jgi:hypothetical protein
MIDEEAPADLGSGMNLDPSYHPADMCDEAREQAKAEAPAFVRQAMKDDGVKSWVTEYHFES